MDESRPTSQIEGSIVKRKIAAPIGCNRIPGKFNNSACIKRSRWSLAIKITLKLPQVQETSINESGIIVFFLMWLHNQCGIQQKTQGIEAAATSLHS